MANRGRGDIRRLAAAPAISGTGGWRPFCPGGGPVDTACAVALALSLRWTPWRPAEPGPVPHSGAP